MRLKRLATTLALAGAMSVPAFAADQSHPAETLVFDNNAAFFGSLFTGGNAGNTFSDRFDFNLASGGSIVADLLSMSGNANNGLDITGYALYGSSGLILNGSQLSSGQTDSWNLSSNVLAAGDYYLLVTGSSMSNSAGKFYGSVTVSPVPEPATYGMLLAGLGLIGFMGRRRTKPGFET
jgi:hypothetical protein